MSLPVSWPSPEEDAGGGHTYGAVLVRTPDAAHAAVLDLLAELRFSGWVSPPEQGWVVAVARNGAGTVAMSRLGVLGAAAFVAARQDATAFAVRVLRDRQLVLAAWHGATELGRYSSDPSLEPGADEDVLAQPLGEAAAVAFAAACDRPDAAEDLEDLLAEELDPDSVSESERLARVLGVLGMPSWLVASASLPRDIPTGPRARDLVRLGAGRTGIRGLVLGRASEVLRRRRLPPPAIADPPRSSGTGFDPWLL